MAKKKKEVELIPPCYHCATEFKVPISWCAKCESHMASAEISEGVCNRCRSGENDEYNAHRVGVASRVEAAIAEIHAKHGPFKPPFTGPLAEAYAAWCKSPAYKDRFKPVDAPPEATPEQDNDAWIEDFAGL